MAIKESIKEQTGSKIKTPKRYQVLLYNDDFTLGIHEGSYAVAGVYPKDIARTKAVQTVQWAREEGYPLKAEAVCEP